MTTEAAKTAKAKYDAKTAVYISLKLNQNTDKDLIDMLGKIENKQGLIKQVLRTASQQQAKEFPPTRYSETLYGCGACGMELTGKPHFCGNCGQAIKW